MTNWSGEKYEHVFDIDGAKVFIAQGTTLQQWKKSQPDMLAFTFNNTIVVQGKKNLTPEVLRHERKHIEQARRMGGELIFRPVLLLSSLWALVTRGDPYDNHFEREAYAAERD
jgi:hypothetical protein